VSKKTYLDTEGNELPGASSYMYLTDQDYMSRGETYHDVNNFY